MITLHQRIVGGLISPRGEQRRDGGDAGAGEELVVTVELQRQVGPVADFPGQGSAGRQGGGEAQAVEADILRVSHLILRGAEAIGADQLLANGRTCDAGTYRRVDDADVGTELRDEGQVGDVRAGDRTNVGLTAVIVEEIGAEFGIQAGHEPA
ncbi:hypothetical protein FQZ97_997570 [compost metagenome]